MRDLWIFFWTTTLAKVSTNEQFRSPHAKTRKWGWITLFKQKFFKFFFLFIVLIMKVNMRESDNPTHFMKKETNLALSASKTAQNGQNSLFFAKMKLKMKFFEWDFF